MWVEAQRMWWGAERGARGLGTWGGQLGLSLHLHPPPRGTLWENTLGLYPSIAMHGVVSLDERLVFCLKIGCVVFPSSALVCLGSWSDVRFNVGLICGGGMVL